MPSPVTSFLSPDPRSYVIDRPVLHTTVTDQLRQMIVEGALPPGSRLNERTLCATLGVSRTPLREALKVLAVEGLIDHNPNRSAMVAVLSEKDISDTFELLGALEALAGELACVHITAQELAELKALHTVMVSCFARGDLPSYYAVNQSIHDKINEAARNAPLRQTFTTVNRRVQALRFRSNLHTEKWRHAMQDHEDMIAALEARDGPRLAAILRAHLLTKRAAVLTVLRAQAALEPAALEAAAAP